MMIKLLLLGLYSYGVFAGNTLLKGAVKNLVFVTVIGTLFALSQFTVWPAWGILSIVAATEVFLFFYSEDLMLEKWYRPLFSGSWLFMMSIVLQTSTFINESIAVIGLVQILFIQLSFRRGYHRIWHISIVTAINLLLTGISLYVVFYNHEIFASERMSGRVQQVLMFLAIAIFILIESTLRSYEKGFLRSTREMREQMLTQQYQEIQAVYLNMRGWRHDYHNHIQVLKATLDQNQLETARLYLDDIEDALRKVDTYVKSGNVMADAILNSKLTLAEQIKINIVCDAFLPDALFISDLDLCTILGNVLDNAIESCEKIEPEERFIRIYLALQKEQLYLSVQNAAQEEINFEQKHFISTKTGNHGLGIKRVAAVVHKWNGYISLNQEPGVFACEIMIPTP